MSLKTDSFLWVSVSSLQKSGSESLSIHFLFSSKKVKYFPNYIIYYFLSLNAINLKLPGRANSMHRPYKRERAPVALLLDVY